MDLGQLLGQIQRQGPELRDVAADNQVGRVDSQRMEQRSFSPVAPPLGAWLDAWVEFDEPPGSIGFAMGWPPPPDWPPER